MVVPLAVSLLVNRGGGYLGQSRERELHRCALGRLLICSNAETQVTMRHAVEYASEMSEF
jgi:hypothetical protein